MFQIQAFAQEGWCSSFCLILKFTGRGKQPYIALMWRFCILIYLIAFPTEKGATPSIGK